MSLKKKSFVLYENYENTFRLLSLEQRGALITAIFEYERQQKVDIPLTKSTKVAFQNIKDTLDRDRESYLKKCEQRSACGKSGGRPSKTALTEENPKSKSFFSNPDNENDIDIDIENDIDSDIDSESENEKGNGMGNFPPSRSHTVGYKGIGCPSPIAFSSPRPTPTGVSSLSEPRPPFEILRFARG